MYVIEEEIEQNHFTWAVKYVSWYWLIFRNITWLICKGFDGLSIAWVNYASTNQSIKWPGWSKTRQKPLKIWFINESMDEWSHKLPQTFADIPRHADQRPDHLRTMMAVRGFMERLFGEKMAMPRVIHATARAAVGPGAPGALHALTVRRGAPVTSSSKLLLSPPVPDSPPLPLPVNSEPAMLRLRRIGSWPAPATNRPPRPPPAPPPPPLGRRERDVVGSGWLIDWLHGAIPENHVALRPYRVEPHRNPRFFGIIQKYE